MTFIKTGPCMLCPKKDGEVAVCGSFGPQHCKECCATPASWASVSFEEAYGKSDNVTTSEKGLKNE